LSDTLARLDKIKQMTKRSVESSSNTYVYLILHLTMSLRHSVDLRNFARNLPHSSPNPMSVLLLQHKHVSHCQILATYGLKSKTILRVCISSLHFQDSHLTPNRLSPHDGRSRQGSDNERTNPRPRVRMRQRLVVVTFFLLPI
jgi:hypothetical protein